MTALDKDTKLPNPDNTLATNGFLENSVDVALGPLDALHCLDSGAWALDDQPADHLFRAATSALRDLISRHHGDMDGWIGEAGSSPPEIMGNTGGSGAPVKVLGPGFGSGFFAKLLGGDDFASTTPPPTVGFFAEMPSTGFAPLFGPFHDDGEGAGGDGDGGGPNEDGAVADGMAPERGGALYLSTGAVVSDFSVVDLESNGPELGFATTASFFPIVFENAPAGTFVVVGGGVSRRAVEYSLTDDADGRFDIDAQTGLITVEDGTKIDYETDADHAVEVTTTYLDGATSPDVETLTVFVRDVNEAPTAITLDNATVEENAGGVIVGILTTEDQDVGNSHDYTVSDLQFEVVGGQLKLKDGISLDHEDEPGVPITVTAIDEGGLSVEQSFTIAVTDVNEAPSGLDDEVGTTENTAISVDVLANDTDVDAGDDPATFSLDSVSIASVTGLTGGGTGIVSIDGNQLRFDPGSDFDELDEGDTATVVVDYAMSDDEGVGATAQATITVTGVNDAPVVEDVTAASVEDGPAVTGVFIGDDVDADDEGVALTYSLTSLPRQGVVVDIDDNTFTFDPGADFQDLGEGETRDLTFSYRATDSNGGISNIGTLTVTVTGVNDAPTLDMNTGKTMDEGSSELLSVTELSASDPDNSNAEIVYTVTTGPQRGQLELSTNQGQAITSFTQEDLAAARVIYVHDGGKSASDSFIFDVNDPAGTGPESQQFEISVNPVNDAPTLDVNTGTTVNEGGAKLLSAAELSASDSDNTSAEIVYTVTAGPQHGQLELSTNQGQAITAFTQEDLAVGRVVYVHDGGESASDSFIFDVDDPAGTGPESQLFQISVNPVNDAPILDVNGGKTVDEGSSELLSAAELSASDPDNSNAEIVYTVTTGPQHGQLELVTNLGQAITSFTQEDLAAARVVYVHGGGKSASDSFIFDVDDPAGTGPESQQFEISVNPVNDAPTLDVNTGTTVNEGGAKLLSAAELSASDSDNTSAEIVYTVTAGPQHGQLELSTNQGQAITAFTQEDLAVGRVVYVHDGGESASDSFIFDVDDPAGTGPESQLFQISVNPVNDAPILDVNGGKTVDEGSSELLSVTELSASDPDNSNAEIVYTVTTGPQHGQLELVTNLGQAITSFTQEDLAAARVVYVHGGGESASDSFIFDVDDPAGTGPESQQFEISVNPVNDAPTLDVNTGTTVNEGGAKLLSAAELSASDSDNTSAEIVYTVTAGPQHGQLELSTNQGQAITAFTQEDLAVGRVVYVHDGGESASDSFIFDVDDPAGTGPESQLFQISVNPVNDAPILDVNTGTTVNEGGAKLLSAAELSASDSDNTSAEIVYTVTTGPQHGQLELFTNLGQAITSFTQEDLAAARVVYVHGGGKSASDSFIFDVDDPAGTGPESQLFQISVNPVNDAPTLDVNALTIQEGQTKLVGPETLGASDPDTSPGNLTFTIGDLSVGQFERVTDPGTAIEEFTQAEVGGALIQFVHDGSEQPPAYTVTLSDGEETVGPVQADVTFLGSNDAPVVENVTVAAVEDGAAVTGSFIGDDVDSDDDGTTLTYAVTTVPSEGGVGNNGDGTFTFDPGLDFQDLAIGETRDVTFDYTATDSNGAVSNTATVTFTVTGVNDAPLVADVTASASEDGPVVTGSFVGDDVDSDDDGTTLTYAITALPGEGSVVDNDDGTFGFDPGTDFQDLAVGETRNVTFAYTATDVHGAISNTGTVTVTVTGINDAPVAVDVTAAAVEDGPAVTGSFVGDDVDSDDDGSTLTYSVTSLPSEGTVTDIDEDSFTFDPDTGFQDLAEGETRDVTFGYAATDRNGGVSNTGTVTVTVTGVNDAPVVEDVTAAATEDGPAVTGSFVGDDVDSDDDGTTLTYAITASPSEGGVVNNGDGTFTFDPGPDFQDLAIGENRDVTFDYTSTDNNGAVSNTGVVTVTVTGVNDVPVVTDVAAAAVEDGQAVTASFAGDDADSDDDGSTLTYEITSTIGSSPTGGSVVNNGDGTFTFDPGVGFQYLGQDETRDVTFDYIATDSNGAVSNTGVATVTVTGVNDPPVDLSLSNNRVSENPSNGTIVGTIYATDADNEDGFEYELTDTAGGAFAIEPVTGRLTVGNALVLDFENPLFEGIYSIEVKVTDPNDESYTERMDIVLTDFNEAPTGIDPTFGEVLADTDNGTVVATLSTIDPDITPWSPTPETFTYALLDNARGRFALDGDRIVVADGARIDEGDSYELFIRSTDKGGLSTDQTLVISANPPPPPLSVLPALDDIGLFAATERDGFDAPGAMDPFDGGAGSEAISDASGLGIFVLALFDDDDGRDGLEFGEIVDLSIYVFDGLGGFGGFGGAPDQSRESCGAVLIDLPGDQSVFLTIVSPDNSMDADPSLF